MKVQPAPCHRNEKGIQYSLMTVSYRPLVPDAGRSAGAAGADDNLHALKALLPRYAGRVKCIYIDPPCNTGNEGWVYNDKVNSPLMKANGPARGVFKLIFHEDEFPAALAGLDDPQEPLRP